MSTDQTPTDRRVPAERAAALHAEIADAPDVALTAAQQADLELIATGAYTPLDRFMSAEEAATTSFPVPVTLAVPEARRGAEVLALRDHEGVLLAVARVRGHGPTPAGEVVVDADLEIVALPPRYDHLDLRVPPSATRQEGEATLAYVPDGPLTTPEIQGLHAHAAHEGARILLLVPAGDALATDAVHHAEVRAHRHAAAALGATAVLSPLRRQGDEDTFRALARVVASAHGAATLLRPSDLEGAESARARMATALAKGADLPQDLVPAAIAAELHEAVPTRAEAGLTVFFTGLSGSGKSTVARALLAKLLGRGGRTVTLLDGDLVRQHLSSELGFSREHRDLNVERIGYVASEVTKHGGIAIAAPIAPYAATRQRVRDMVSAQGGFVLVHVATPLEVCEARDRKGLYAKARQGLISAFTGISDPYEEPGDAEIVIDTTSLSPEKAAQHVLDQLVAAGYLSGAR